MNIKGAKLYLAAFALAVWTAYFNLGSAPVGDEIAAWLAWVLPIAGGSVIPFLGVELADMLRDFARRLAGDDEARS